jgi:hypothetical protein
MKIIELTSKEAMMAHIDVLQELYPNLTQEYYSQLLDQMLGNNYTGWAQKCGADPTWS